MGQTVTAHFFGNGVIVDANIQQMAGSTQPLNFAGGPIPKNSQAIPYPGANRVEAKNAKLRDVTFVATNSSWMELNVMGPDGSVGKCTAGLHVNMGPALNTDADSWGSETLVQLVDGSHKKISQLQFGDRVWNPQFKEAASVVHIHQTAPTSSMVALDLGSSVVHVTSHHPFLSQRGLVLAQDLRAGDQLPAADASWKTVLGNRAYRPADGYKVYDVFLNSPRSARDRLMNVEGLLVPSYEWQSQLAILPSSTLFDMPQLPNLW
ncbi:MAG: HINT domain-containing protein [Pseudobdellovibrionaceae bacterium]|nr:HINT domain-containing protein [Pseudobdellovibrionaceae bacterium]